MRLVAMATFTSAFRPALNREGYAKLTFLGSGSQSGSKDGKDWEIFKLVFEVQGVVRGTNQKITIVTNYQYSEDNQLGRALKGMGFVPEPLELIQDEDGFDVVDAVQDEDGFEVVDDAQLPDIEGFLKSCEGRVFIGKVNKIVEGKRKGFWEVDVDSIKPFMKGSVNGKV